MNNYIVYKHINRINGKIYIGITNDKKRRWRNQGIEYKNSGKNNFFYNAIVKYGWDNFEHVVLLNNLTKEEAEVQEVILIQESNSTDKHVGYNISPGGNGGHVYQEHPRGMLGKHQSEKFRKIHSEWASDHNNNVMTNGKVVWGKTHKHPKGMSGHKQSSKHAEAMKKLSGEKNQRSIHFLVTFPDGRKHEFYGYREIVEALGISQNTILKLYKTGLPYGNSINSMKNNVNYGITIEKIPS